MFGFGTRSKGSNVRLAEKQMREVTKNMSRSERRQFERQQAEAEDDLEWDMLMMMEAFDEDD